MIMAPVTTERIAAPIYLPVRPAAEVIGEWREDSLFIEPDKTRDLDEGLSRWAVNHTVDDSD